MITWTNKPYYHSLRKKFLCLPCWGWADAWSIGATLRNWLQKWIGGRKRKREVCALLPARRGIFPAGGSMTGLPPYGAPSAFGVTGTQFFTELIRAIFQASLKLVNAWDHST